MTEFANLTPQELALLQQVRTFADDVVAPAAPEWDRNRAFGRDAIGAAAKLGLTGLQVPVAMGGLGHSFSCKAQVTDIVAGADFGFAMSLINTQNVAYKLSRDASPEVAQRYIPALLSGDRLGSTALTEPHAGSDFAAITTLATPNVDGWSVTGKKAWIINTVASDIMVLYAQTEAGSGGAGIAAFLIDGTRDGFVRSDRFEMTAQHTIGAGGFELRDYQIRHDELLQPAGEAFKVALRDINGARIYVAAMCCGMVDAALQVAANYGRNRKTFGRRLGEHQGWRWTLGEADVDLSAARQMVGHASGMIDRNEDAQFAAAKTKIFATRMAERHLPALAQLMGAEGLQDKHPFGRHLIGARIAGFVDGSTEMLLERLTGTYAREAKR
ncbi:MAG: alkylation response protein AidB-like acyl-CoA dehydrogenase [Hyphomicrobiaceae bacterium]|jgi:alkylation response protein AidB-like acyl-CoA dehydrogenase